MQTRLVLTHKESVKLQQGEQGELQLSLPGWQYFDQ